MPRFFKPLFLLLPILLMPVLVTPTATHAAALQPLSLAPTPPVLPRDEQPVRPRVRPHPGATPSAALDPLTTCDYDALVGQAFTTADLSIITAPFRISYTHAPPLKHIRPRITILVDLQTDRILGIHCPTPR